MTCEIQNIVTFSILLSARMGALALLGYVVENMKWQLREEQTAAITATKIRPWFFGDNIEPQGLIIIVAGETGRR